MATGIVVMLIVLWLAHDLPRSRYLGKLLLILLVPFVLWWVFVGPPKSRDASVAPSGQTAAPSR